jgi:hypothetical protein
MSFRCLEYDESESEDNQVSCLGLINFIVFQINDFSKRQVFGGKK